MPNIAGYLTKLKNAEPDRTVEEIYDFDSQWVLVKAPSRPGRREFNAMFLVSKVGQEVKPFLPFSDPDKYLAAITKSPIYEVT